MFHTDDESDHDDHDHAHIMNIKEKGNSIKDLSHHLNCVMEKHFNLQTLLCVNQYEKVINENK